MADNDLRDLAGGPGLLAVVPKEDFGAGLQSVFDTIGIEQAAHDPAGDVSAIYQRNVSPIRRASSTTKR